MPRLDTTTSADRQINLDEPFPLHHRDMICVSPSRCIRFYCRPCESLTGNEFTVNLEGKRILRSIIRDMGPCISHQAENTASLYKDHELWNHTEVLHSLDLEFHFSSEYDAIVTNLHCTLCAESPSERNWCALFPTHNTVKEECDWIICEKCIPNVVFTHCSRCTEVMEETNPVTEYLGLHYHMSPRECLPPQRCKVYTTKRTVVPAVRTYCNETTLDELLDRNFSALSGPDSYPQPEPVILDRGLLPRPRELPPVEQMTPPHPPVTRAAAAAPWVPRKRTREVPDTPEESSEPPRKKKNERKSVFHCTDSDNE